MSHPKSNTKRPDFLALKKLGLRENAIACYGALYMHGWQTAGQLAESLKIPRTSVYHALEQLEKMGFAEREKIESLHLVTEFKAIRLDKALENLAVQQRHAVKELIDFQIEESIKERVDRRLP